MSVAEKCRIWHCKGEVSKEQERWIFIECEAFEFSCEYLVGIIDCKTTAIALERVSAQATVQKFRGLRRCCIAHFVCGFLSTRSRCNLEVGEQKFDL